jgi:hypothetical protein
MKPSYQDLRNVVVRSLSKNATSYFVCCEYLKDIELTQAGLKPQSSTQASC